MRRSERCHVPEITKEHIASSSPLWNNKGFKWCGSLRKNHWHYAFKLCCYVVQHTFESKIKCIRPQWRIQGGKSGHGPQSKLALWICRKERILAPRIDVGYGFAPRPMEKYHIKTFWEDRWQFCGEMLKFVRETKVVHKFRQKFGSPVSEVLDPLVLGPITHLALK